MKRRRLIRVLSGMAAGVFACAIYIYLTLPDVRTLRASNPTITAFMDLRAREARAKKKPPRRVQRWISYARVSPNLTRAVLVAEDDAFWQHEGVDFDQLRESVEIDLARGRLTRGASTITQQLAKNLYLSPSKNPLRKIRELVLARRLEAELKKARILEIYLNVIEWGDGIYGADAAARTHFGTSASTLAPAQAALLAGAIINPRVLTPSHPTARLLRRQQLILRRMGSVSPPAPESGPSSNPADDVNPINTDEPNRAEPPRSDPRSPIDPVAPAVEPPIARTDMQTEREFTACFGSDQLDSHEGHRYSHATSGPFNVRCSPARAG